MELVTIGVLANARGVEKGEGGHWIFHQVEMTIEKDFHRIEMIVSYV